ncbi:helix-turn-helix transcriptional regulator [Yinghuangia aomiensis]|uniref:Helix-turn-helix transcriptional regulator n=1 Tax=Yinghuangia aomiensis TaxID=676205 RepID=A0ABP9GJ74_9ACTN
MTDSYGLDVAGGRPDVDAAHEGGDAASDFFRALGRQVRVLRERKGWSRREFGSRIGYGEDQITSLELGRRIPQEQFLNSADELLDADGVLKATTEDVARAKARVKVRHPAWFRDYARLEAQAVELHFYSTMAIPGLMQTEAYAREIFESSQPLLEPEEIDERVAARLARQEILKRRPPTIITAVVHEWVLRQPFGGRTVQKRQLARLLEIAELRNVELQVMPNNSTGHAGMSGPFTLLTPPERTQIAYVEVQHVSRIISDPREVRALAAKYGSLRAAAMTPRETLALIEGMLEAS